MLSTRAIRTLLQLSSATPRRSGKRAMSSSADDVACELAEKFKLPKRYGKGEKSVWVEFIEVAAKTKALNLGQGFPDYAPPKYVTEALRDVACGDPALMQYTRGYGHPRLVKIIAKLYSKLLDREINPLTEVLITCGAYEALFCCIQGLCEEGDEVIIIEPYFDCYEPMATAAGAKARFIPLRLVGKNDDEMIKSSDFCLDQEELEGMFNDKTKLIILNTPNNPLGKVYSYEELEFIANLCKKWNVICISDEVYEWMVFKPKCHIRMASLPGMWERTLTVGSAGKTFSVTGWKTGWAYGPENIMKNLQVCHQTVIYAHSTPIQEAIAIAFEKEEERMDTDPENCFFYTIINDLTPKRDFMCKFLADSGMKPVIPEGGYFIIADWSPLEAQIDLSSETDKWKDYRMAKWMAKNVGLLGIPPTAFYYKNKKLAETYIRYCFIKEDQKLQQAADILKKMKEKYGK